MVALVGSLAEYHILMVMGGLFLSTFCSVFCIQGRHGMTLRRRLAVARSWHGFVSLSLTCEVIELGS